MDNKTRRKTSKSLFLIISGAVVILVFLVVWALGGFIRGRGGPEETTMDPGRELFWGYVGEFFEGKYIELSAFGKSVQISLKDSNAPIDEEALRRFFEEKLYDTGLIDAYFDDIGKYVPDGDSYITQKIDELAGFAEPRNDSTYEILDGAVKIIRGTKRTVIDTQKTKSLVKTALYNFRYEKLNAATIVEEPSAPDWEDLRAKVCKDPADARYEKDENGKVVLVKEIIGSEVDIEQIKQEYNTQSWREKTYPIKELLPGITEENIEGELFSDVLSEYTSTYIEYDYNRTTNVRLASKAIDGSIILPGERFSFNEIVGPRTKERGYLPAPIFAGADTKDELGGGICQVSSTIYVATLHTINIKQIERGAHSKKVTYVPEGWDATIYWGLTDYKFENNTGYPIKITIECKNGKLTVKLLGVKTHEVEVKLETELVETYKSEVETVDDPTLPPGKQEVRKQGTNGCKLKLYRTLTIDGVEQPREYVNTSTYLATKTVIAQGPEVTETTPPETTATTPPETTVTTPPETTVTPPPETTVTTPPLETTVTTPSPETTVATPPAETTAAEPEPPPLEP
jgi:vancomycin resistance protein YoaR